MTSSHLYIFKNILFALFAFSMFACSSEIDVSLNSTDPKIVVYGAITTDTLAHRVEITQTADFFSNSPAKVISGAALSITDGVNLFPLTESPSEPGVYYTAPDVYGLIGKTYTLTADNVLLQGAPEAKTLIAQSTIPDLDPNYQTDYLDSINVLYNEQWEGWYVNAWATEPADQKNFYMFKVYINDVLYSDSLNNIIISDDKLFNGNAISGAGVYFIEDADTLKAGYKVTLEMCVVSEDHYYFMFESQTSSHPQIPLFSPPPANARTNISNGAIGYFSAYAILRTSYYVKQRDVDIKNRLIGKRSRLQ
ncbi:MAG: DUF4249 domain-containing protein [Bacteroidales bacterium]|nr:DUF4249 domain-containing protein [Bacteroidales bacterium]